MLRNVEYPQNIDFIISSLFLEEGRTPQKKFNRVSSKVKWRKHIIRFHSYFLNSYGVMNFLELKIVVHECVLKASPPQNIHYWYIEEFNITPCSVIDLGQF